MTPAGLAALKAELRLDEGEELSAYPDSGSALGRACAAHKLAMHDYRKVAAWQKLSGAPWTCGYGATGPDIRAGLVWTQAQAEGRLTADIAKAEADCARYLAFWAKLDDARAEVLTNLAFNLGIAGLLKWKHMLAAVEAGEYARAAADMLATEPWCSQVGKRAERLAGLMQEPVRRPA